MQINKKLLVDELSGDISFGLVSKLRNKKCGLSFNKPLVAFGNPLFALDLLPTLYKYYIQNYKITQVS